MSTIYLIPKPPDKLGRKNRETGWRSVPFDRLARKEMEQHAEQLRDKGISVIYCSDLDTRYAEIMRDAMHVPHVRPDFQFRRFNVGRHHAAPSSDVDNILQGLTEKWEKNKDVPIRGGDSMTSFEKRFVMRFKKLLEGEGISALIVDQRCLAVIRDLSNNKFNLKSIVPNGNAPAMDRIYKVESASRTEAKVDAAAAVRG